jgi:hypothetical protein
MIAGGHISVKLSAGFFIGDRVDSLLLNHSTSSLRIDYY